MAKTVLHRHKYCFRVNLESVLVLVMHSEVRTRTNQWNMECSLN